MGNDMSTSTMTTQGDLIVMMSKAVTEDNPNPSIEQIKETIKDLLIDCKSNTETRFLSSAPDSDRLFWVTITPGEEYPNVAVSPYDSKNPTKDDYPVFDLSPLAELLNEKAEATDPTKIEKISGDLDKITDRVKEALSNEDLDSCGSLIREGIEILVSQVPAVFDEKADQVISSEKPEATDKTGKAMNELVEFKEKMDKALNDKDTDSYSSLLQEGVEMFTAQIPEAIRNELMEQQAEKSKPVRDIPSAEDITSILDELDELTTDENRSIVANVKLMVTLASAITEDVPNPSTEQIKATILDSLVDIETDDENTFFVDVGHGLIFQITTTQGETETDIRMRLYDPEHPEGSGEPPIDLNPMLDGLCHDKKCETAEDSFDSKLGEMLAGLIGESKRTLSVDDMAREALSETLCEALEMEQIISPTGKVPRLVKDLGDKFLKGTPQHAICEPLGWTTLVNIAGTHWKSALCTLFEAGKQYLTGNPISSLHLPTEMNSEFKEIRASVDPEDLEATSDKISQVMNQYYKTVLHSTNGSPMSVGLFPTHPDLSQGLAVYISPKGTLFVTPLLVV